MTSRRLMRALRSSIDTLLASAVAFQHCLSARLRQSVTISLIIVLALTSHQAVARSLLVLGDSLSAGYGLQPEQGWVFQLEQSLAASPHSRDIDVINASISGDTSAGGLSRLPRLLATHTPQWIIIELGGNDGLRGFPLNQLEQNLRQIIEQSRQAGALPILLGMQIPSNYGARYTREFEAVYTRLAADLAVDVIPQWLAPVGSQPDLMQSDGIHPNAQAQSLLLQPVNALLKTRL